MRWLEEVTSWFQKRDEKILEQHLNKDREALKRSLAELEENWYELRQTIDNIEDVIEREEAKAVDTSEEEKKKPKMYAGGELKDVSRKLDQIWAKEKGERSDEEKSYLVKELGRMKAVRNRLEKRLQKLEEIIAKTRVLLDDLNEDLCHELSGGRSLATVGQALSDKFGDELKEDRVSGRKTIRKFLEEHYHIDSHASRQLFNLLEEVGILRYRVDIPEALKTEPISYYNWEEDALSTAYVGPTTELFGVWEIHA